MPKIHESCFIAHNAEIIGKVTIEKNCGIYFNAIIRAEQNTIEIGEGSNIQDCCIIHVDYAHKVKIGKNVSIGHGAVIHGATIEDDCLIGINATVLNGAKIRSGSIIGANALVTVNMEVPKNSLVLGVPGKIMKQDETLIDIIRANAETYRELSQNHKEKKYIRYASEK